MRISLGGGGTDLPSYYEKYQGFLISGAINKYLFVGANKQFFDDYLIKYSKTERVKNISDIKHPLVRESLKLLKIEPGIEITSLADIAAGTGMGSSDAFLISLLNTLHHYKGENISKRHLSQEACNIVLNILKEHDGKQDKYCCSFGNINAYKFHRNGNVSIIPLINEDIIRAELENKLILFFTGMQRTTTVSSVLKQQDEKTKAQDEAMLDALHKIKDIGIESKAALEDGNFDDFGHLLNKHWEIKKKYSPHSTNDFIDNCYKTARSNGALGGKICGAGGGGGFFLFYHPGPEKEKWAFIDTMTGLGLHYMHFRFDNIGVTTITKEELE